jgi:hypothetical protein
LAILFALFILSSIYYQDKVSNVSNVNDIPPKKVSILKMANVPIVNDKDIIASIPPIIPKSTLHTKDTSSNVSNVLNVSKREEFSGEEINKKLQEYTKQEKDLQKQYQLGFGKYKYNVLDGEQPVKGLYVDYMKNYKSTLPSICNKMVVEPDLNFPYANLLSK